MDILMKLTRQTDNISDFVGNKLYFATDWLYSFTPNSHPLESIEFTEVTLTKVDVAEGTATLTQPNGEEVIVFLDMLDHYSIQTKEL